MEIINKEDGGSSSSLISCAKTVQLADEITSSDHSSNSNNYTLLKPNNKRARVAPAVHEYHRRHHDHDHDHHRDHVDETDDDDDHHHQSSFGNNKFKGVVPQLNGNWGAQIYANHHRIWLGTFKSEKQAAMAYDSASIKLRKTRDHHHHHHNYCSQRNFPWNPNSIHEPIFQDKFSTDDVLNMIKDGTYSSKFSSFLNSSKSQTMSSSSTTLVMNGGHNTSLRSHLFEKELTPSDVGKLNRLVIPKKHAVKHFPYINYEVSEHDQEEGEELTNNNNNNGVENTAVVEDTELVFYDSSMKVWKFRYCYWKSSQSFVFTRGWNRFVKEKKLKAKDIVIFDKYESEKHHQIIQNHHHHQTENDHQKMGNYGQTHLYLIDVIYKRSSSSSEDHQNQTQIQSRIIRAENNNNNDDDEMMMKNIAALKLNLGSIGKIGGGDDDDKQKVLMSEKPIVRLFGVQIN